MRGSEESGGCANDLEEDAAVMPSGMGLEVGSRTLGGGRTICASVRGRASGSRAAPPPKE